MFFFHFVRFVQIVIFTVKGFAHTFICYKLMVYLLSYLF